MGKSVKVLLVFIMSIAIIFTSYTSAQAEVKSDYKLYVMAPLGEITDWDQFERQLVQMKKNGVYGLTTDVWWGIVEAKGDNQFDWSYYKKYASAVEDSGLKWVPILSTHQCGGNVGDDCNYPIPNWLWKKDNIENMAFKSESGFVNKEALAPWWGGIEKQYGELYRSFAKNFADYDDVISKIYLSGGPAGELRYPSYQFADGWDYPERGQLQAYTEGAKEDFRDEMKHQYKNIKNLNKAWRTSFKTWDKIEPPADGDAFFRKGEAYNTAYGKDFMKWYQGALEDHLQTISKQAHKYFDRTFDVEVGAKISGVHWKMNDPEMPHAAEYSTGYYDYAKLLDQFKKSNMALTFTCLEMGDQDAQTAPYYSAPKTLVTQIATLANERNLSLNGENALPIINNEWGFDNASEMVFNYDFDGFTLLRMTYLFDEAGNPTNELRMLKDKLALEPLPVTLKVSGVQLEKGQTLHVTGNRGELGRWNTSSYHYILKQKSDGTFEGTFDLAADRQYEFKFYIKDQGGEIIWQDGENQNYHTPAKGKGSYLATW